MQSITKITQQFIFSIVFSLVCSSSLCQTPRENPVDLVYPQLGTAHSRWFYFSSASRPFGMVSLMPDTKIDGEWNSGYCYNIDTVKCLSHIHEWQLSGVAVMPVRFTGDDLTEIFTNYSSPFSHKLERIRPGYHAILLNRFKVLAHLTATNRVGFHEYIYDLEENTMRPGVIVELGGRLGPSDIIRGGFKKTSANEIHGFVVNGPTIRRPKECPVFFSIEFNEPIKQIHFFKDGKITEGIEDWEGENGRILVEFHPLAGLSLRMKVGVSFTSEEGAARNRKAEVQGWDFYRVVNEASAQWNDMLSRIMIEGGTRAHQQRFYTDLAHAIQGRRMISDADGKYADFTGKERVIRQLPVDDTGRPLFNMYNSDAFWGAQWTLNTLWQLVYPEVAEEFCNSFFEYYKNGGLIPRGPSGGNYTYVMTGASSTPFFVSAWQKGLRGFGGETVYEAVKKNHFAGGMMSKAGYEHGTFKGGGIEHYITNGFVPYPLDERTYGYHQDGAGMTMEYAYQDWALAQWAKALQKTDDYNYFMKRAGHYRNLYNPATGYIHPRDVSGKWKDPFDPLQYDHGFVEGNAAQLTWFVPHDLPGLFKLMGGNDSAIVRLNKQFEQAVSHRFCNEHPEKDPKFVNNRQTWINYSNQPNSQAAFIFNHAGAPWLTQHWSREVTEQAFNNLSPVYGYNGDEDQGLMGALSVLMKIGLFQMTGGCEEDPYYEIGSPVFDVVTIKLNQKYYNGQTFRIETRNNSYVNRYINAAYLHDEPLKSFRFRHSDLVKGGTLLLEMSGKPAKDWGVEKDL